MSCFAVPFPLSTRTLSPISHQHFLLSDGFFLSPVSACHFSIPRMYLPLSHWLYSLLWPSIYSVHMPRSIHHLPVLLYLAFLHSPDLSQVETVRACVLSLPVLLSVSVSQSACPSPCCTVFA